MRNEQDAHRAKRAFLWAWGLVAVAKLLVAARLPPFVDEAFYWQEGRHLALAYSDLPGLTAWLARLGTTVAGTNVFGLRWPFLLLGAALPWLVVRIARQAHAPRASDEHTDDRSGDVFAWQAGLLAVLLPLGGLLGLLALPDVPIAFATLLCIHAGGRLLRKVDAGGALELAAGLAIGALSHYRFAAVIGVGLVAMLAIPRGRALLKDVRVWVALAVGAIAWVPLIVWNIDNADAGLRFQLVDRHPWRFHFDGAWFFVVQALLATPLLFAAMAHAAVRGWAGQGADDRAFARYCALLGGLTVIVFGVLAFFADNERVSFHWTLPGLYALLPLVPATLAQWPRGWRRATWSLAVAGLVVFCSYYLVVASTTARARFAAAKWYPANFAGWDALADAVRDEIERTPGTRVVADNFKIGAELGFALNDPDIAVLPHVLNERHGRAPQLDVWKLLAHDRASLGEQPLLLVVGASEVRYRDLLAHYHALCDKLGPLPPPRVVQIDHGRQRFLLFKLPAQRAKGDCTTPAMAYIDTPKRSARVSRNFEVTGWAFKDGVGIARVEITLDGKTIGTADYGQADAGIRAFWRHSNDPNHPYVAWTAHVRAGAVSPGLHWLGLRLVGNDGAIEEWPEQPLRIVD
ncbi:glycosyltransferase family 39 protein [Lysobacter sp. A6]|uniref:Glycosyltransferase family 39 protein n=1 Tax=Noviluteimonas lactosilytica TaxID=2888523 RepID=A0ABS8JEM5_9GAMM|nr:glycosyltransferase family 39 protein [Lysobacter lactosilyticus]MCC8362051.1 glycosyltransferase family 39 protein [Lysobacter lactosilyticus]